MGTTPVYSYPFDPTGSAPSNLIPNEVHVITAVNFRDYNFVIPNLAPFFGRSMKITFRDAQGVTRPFVEGIDYYLGFQFIAASRACALPVYGAVSFLNTQLVGTVFMTYQTIGGEWTLDQTTLANLLANTLVNPRTASWDSIVALPATFPVIDHQWDLVDMVGTSELVSELEGIRLAIQAGNADGLTLHLQDFNNPHQTTKAQVGLALVQNYAPATQADAQQGAADNLYMTPVRTKDAIQQFALTPLAQHIQDLGNPHKVTAAQVGLGSVQNYTMASDLEAQAGVVTDRYMSPESTRVAIAAQVGQALQDHMDDLDNPHEVTAAQVGAYSKLEINQMLAGLDTNGGQAAVDLQAHLEDFNNPHRVTAAQVGAYSKLEITQLLQGYLASTGTATNTAKFNGMDANAYAAWVLTGKAANSDQLGGYTPDALKTWILTGTAANANTIGGKSFQDIVNAAAAAASTGGSGSALEGFTEQRVMSAAPVDVGATYNWVKLVTMPMVDPANPTATHPDAQVLVAGGDDVSDRMSTLYYIRLSVRGASGDGLSFQILNLAGVDVGAVFGYTKDTTAKTVSLWLRTAPGHSRISTTNLAEGAATLEQSDTYVIVEPTGIAYLTETKQVADSQLFAGYTVAQFTTLILNNSAITTMQSQITELQQQVLLLTQTMSTALDTLRTQLLAK